MRRAGLVLALLALLPPAPASADCVQCGCSVSTTGLVFGLYNPRRPVSASVATVNVICDSNTGYVVKLSAGSSGDVTNRTLHNGANILAYNLYKDSARTMLWGDGSGGQSGVSGAGNASYNVYGGIFGNQTPFVGTYVDTLILSVEY